MKNLIIIGAGDAGKELASFIKNDKESNFNIVGFIDDNKFNLETIGLIHFLYSVV